ncbi:hypothetical protein BH10BAC2_BH10BAC2_02380 [soil metagenome]
MANKKNPIIYKRDKQKMEISGDPEDVKGYILIDQLWQIIIIVIIAILLFCITPKASLFPLVWQWFRKYLPFMILFPGTAIFTLMLSG